MKRVGNYPVESFHSLEKGLRVLAFVSTSPGCSLHDLHVETGFSKPSLLRILHTLVETGYVVKRVSDGKYRASAFSRIGKKPDRYDRVVEAAGPVLDGLCRKVCWPSDLLVPAGAHMERRETTQVQSPFFAHPARRDEVGQRVGWLLTGVGRAYLAFCPERERERIVARLRISEYPDDIRSHDAKWLNRVLDETRERGYGVREPTFTGGPHGDGTVDDHLAAIAIPLKGRERVWGSVNLLWHRSAFSIPDFASMHLSELQEAAREIVKTVEARAVQSS